MAKSVEAILADVLACSSIVLRTLMMIAFCQVGPGSTLLKQESCHDRSDENFPSTSSMGLCF
jgi:hypothetical protein